MLTIEDLAAALPLRPGAPSVALDGDVATLTYPSDEAYCRRVSADVEALRWVAGYALAASWTIEAPAPAAVCLRYAPAPAVEAPRPVAPAPVPASPSRRR
jgi:hypothetical protein